MDLRREFIRRLGENERLSDLCREYGISRKAGDKFKKRFEQLGVEGLPARLPEFAYPGFDDIVRVNRQEQLYISGIGGFTLSAALAGEHVAYVKMTMVAGS